MQRDITNKNEAVAEVVDEARRYSRELDRMELEDRNDGLKGAAILAGIIAIILGIYFLIQFFRS